MAERRPRRSPKARRRLASLTRGEAIAAVAAVLLLAFLFFDWYGAEVSGQAREIKLGGGASAAGGNAWQTLEVGSVLFALVALAAIGAAALRLSRAKWSPEVPPSAVVAVGGGLATLAALFRILAPPDLGNFGGIPLNASVQIGAYLGLAASAGIAYGGYRAMGERGTSFAQIAEELSSRRRRRPKKIAPKRPPRPAKSASQRRSQSSSD
ncbi:MAG TPA: hypothetical protein VLL27_14855 [Solirubrobacterales bacterium]|nr:hypothetical protein [Solirubrobacterales bacterium]